MDKKVCKDGRIWGQNNKESHSHLGILSGRQPKKRKYPYAKWNSREMNPNWKGGISTKNHLIRTSIQAQLWKQAVLARDNWTCQHCGRRGGDMHVHHIKAFATYIELRFAIDNGITLCSSCHRKEHNKKGWR